MLKKFITFILSISFLVNFSSKADEGMWLPLLIKRLNYTDMQKLGLKLTADEIYSVNNSSLKDAIVNFGNFCTGEVISKDGLVLTNHHCGYESVQSHSTIEHDYLTDGFWSKNRSEELPNNGLTVTFLIRMEDVTQQVLGSFQPGMKQDEIEAKIEEVNAELEKKAVVGTHYTAEVKSFFDGNEYYLFVYETYKDIRLVGAPPSSIGKFGGDTDNWMWPRHTGDFSMFRIYTGPDGKPAEYSKDNIPLRAKSYLPISLKGIKDNDFTMVFGYPGNTERYLPSEGVKLALEQTNPARIKIREKKLALMKEDMNADNAVRIKYAAKYAEISNYYKYYIGQNQGLKRLKVVDKKIVEEAKFNQWANADPERGKMYGNVLDDYKAIYDDYRKINLAYIYLEEAAFGPEIIMLAYKFQTAFAKLKGNAPPEEVKASLNAFKETADEHFKNYNASTDKKIFAALLQMYYKDINESLQPPIFAEVKKKYKGDFNKFADDVFKKSIFASKEKLDAFLAKPTAKVLEKDPGFNTMNSILNNFRQQAGPFLGSIYERLDKANALYTKGIMEMKKDGKLYPNANFTMRLTYGTVKDYFPRDAVYYNYYTTLNGIMEKEDSTSEEFVVPAKLKDLYKRKDYGRYADQKGIMNVCFITTNDITGGNSGSPVINGSGELIGIAFDGNWEAMSGDIVYEPELQRCIATDIRYILFIIDKMAGATNIVNELTFAENKEMTEELKTQEPINIQSVPQEKQVNKVSKEKEKKLEKVY